LIAVQKLAESPDKRLSGLSFYVRFLAYVRFPV